MTATRRQFLKTATGTATAWIMGCAPRYPVLSAQSADSRIDVLLNEPIGTIAPEIYGHFVENLSGVIYDGIWVGENSKIANTGGAPEATGRSLAQDQTRRDSLPRRLFCRPVRLARRDRATRKAAYAHKLLGQRQGMAEGSRQGRSSTLRPESGWDHRIRTFLQIDRVPALLRGQSPQLAGA